MFNIVIIQNNYSPQVYVEPKCLYPFYVYVDSKRKQRSRITCTWEPKNVIPKSLDTEPGSLLWMKKGGRSKIPATLGSGPTLWPGQQPGQRGLWLAPNFTHFIFFTEGTISTEGEARSIKYEWWTNAYQSTRLRLVWNSIKVQKHIDWELFFAPLFPSPGEPSSTNSASGVPSNFRI